jgi:hypothetical protein
LLLRRTRASPSTYREYRGVFNGMAEAGAAKAKTARAVPEKNRPARSRPVQNTRKRFVAFILEFPFLSS